MQALNINQLSKLYHLRPSQRDRQRLLDASLDEAIEEHLEYALAEAGIEDDEEVCVRLVHVPLCFSFGQSQGETSQHWSSIIARHIRLELDKGGANVIRYRSRLHALLSFADDVSRKQMQRSWAWNQIGLANLRMDANLDLARAQLVTALLREPAAMFAIFTRLAVNESLLPWLSELSTQDRTRLLDGVLSGAGVNRRWLEAKPSLVAAAVNLHTSPLSDRALSGSRILTHLLANANKAAWQSLVPRAWVILILLELEPMLFRRLDSVVAQAIAGIEKRLLPLLVAGSDLSEPDPGRASTESHSNDSHNTSPNRLDREEAQNIENRPDVSVQAPMGTSTGPEAGTEPGRDNVDTVPGGTEASRQPERIDINGTETRDMEPPGEPQTVLAQVEEAAPIPLFITSEFAGLFLLLPLLAETAADDQSSLIEQIAAEPAFSARPLSWILHRLTTHWLSIPTDDPGLRAFCGIDLDGDWPWPADDAATEEETSALAQYAASVETRLRSKLRSSDSDRLSVIEALCQRHAILLIDNGWLELVFELDRVDTEIRRAGLDLYPGFVPWLGKIVKIRYE